MSGAVRIGGRHDQKQVSQMSRHHRPPLEPRPALSALIARLESAQGFAVLRRSDEKHCRAEILVGRVEEVEQIAQVPDPGDGAVLAAIGFRQIAERGYETVDDGTPILVLRVDERFAVDPDDLLRALPEGPDSFEENGFDVDDRDYEQIVRNVLEQEIATGAGSNFVVHRCLTGRLDLGRQSRARSGLGVLRRLLTDERGAYWTFLLHTARTTLVGATPERHVSLEAGVVRMNPISGTLRHPADGFADPAERDRALRAFLDDAKERDELAMVVDEELKMLAPLTADGARVCGPYLKPMAHLTHTEYLLEGRTDAGFREVLTATMFAPTVTGSPIRNACRVIARHERRGRGYYGGVLALVDTDEQGGARLDAPILIRAAQIDPDGAVRVAAGATLVRGSQPSSELAETRAKSAGILAALRGTAPSADAGGSTTLGSSPPRFVTEDPQVRRLLAERNATLARYWLRADGTADAAVDLGPVHVVNAEDDFTAMLAHLLRSVGYRVREYGWAELSGPTGDLLAGTREPVVLGPGPGDPRDLMDRRIWSLRSLAEARLAVGRPVLGVCLGHQVLCLALGLEVLRLPTPDQGRQRSIDLYGRRHRVGFYNSFAARVPDTPVPGVQFATDAGGRRVHAVRGRALAGLQFHAESVLSTDGSMIIAAELSRLTCAKTPAPEHRSSTGHG